MVCWISERTTLLEGGRRTWLKHTHAVGAGHGRALDYRLDVNTLHRDEAADPLALNEIGRVRSAHPAPLMFDAYRRNRVTGSFILIDPATNITVGAGMILRVDRSHRMPAPTWCGTSSTPRRARALRRSGHDGGHALVHRACRGPASPPWPRRSSEACVRSRPARLPARRGQPAARPQRRPRVRRPRPGRERAAGRRGGPLFADAGDAGPRRGDRPLRGRPPGDPGPATRRPACPSSEVFVDTPLDECERRDPKGLYARARAGEFPASPVSTAPTRRPTTPTWWWGRPAARWPRRSRSSSTWWKGSSASHGRQHARRHPAKRLAGIRGSPRVLGRSV